MCKTVKVSLSFGAMRNVHAVSCSAFGFRALAGGYGHSVTPAGQARGTHVFHLQSAGNPRKPGDRTDSLKRCRSSHFAVIILGRCHDQGPFVLPDAVRHCNRRTR
jgi:hypothetical protein